MDVDEAIGDLGDPSRTLVGMRHIRIDGDLERPAVVVLEQRHQPGELVVAGDQLGRDIGDPDAPFRRTLVGEDGQRTHTSLDPLGPTPVLAKVLGEAQAGHEVEEEQALRPCLARRILEPGGTVESDAGRRNLAPGAEQRGDAGERPAIVRFERKRLAIAPERGESLSRRHQAAREIA
jgi:hypothetical protein